MRQRLWSVSIIIAGLSCTGGCEVLRQAHATTESALSLSRVVLYRNGVAYFERVGMVDGDRLSLKVRKDQINDLLKSLTVIDRTSRKTVSVSVPLDPRAWQRAALAMLLPGRGHLAEVLDALRGTEVRVTTSDRHVEGRIVMVERSALRAQNADKNAAPQPQEDHTLTLLDGDTLEVVQLSEVTALRMRDGDLIMQIGRHLDASAGEGMFQQVDVVVHFADDTRHDLSVSYVAAAPLWKPSYRLVLAEDGSGKALLQSWAVVSNTSGENWNHVQLSLTSGAPLAFRYDLHTPEEIPRPDLTQSGVDKHAQVALGESTYAADAAPAVSAPAATAGLSVQDELSASESEYDDAKADVSAQPRAKKSAAARRPRAERELRSLAPPAPPSAVAMATLALQQPTAASAKRVAGLTRFDIADAVTLPDGSASMVQLVNQWVPGEQTFLYRPGGSGQGYELNPYRVVRFENTTDFVLEPGPISIYSGGSFVGEGLSEAIASRDRATIPFAADPSISVRSRSESSNAGVKLEKIVRGVLEVQSFQRVQTTWTIESRPEKAVRRVLVRQPRAAGSYQLVDPPKDTESLPEAYIIPIVLAPEQAKASLEVVEQTPAKLTLEIWDEQAPELLRQLLAANELTPEARATLQPIVDLRQAIGRIDTELAALSEQQEQLDERAEAERQNLYAIKKDPRADALRKRLQDRLEQLTQQAAEIGRRIVELSSQRVEKKIALEDQVRDLDLSPVPAAG
ncbi:MAG: hypothetical protein RL701_4118 [Pseudomonadota bacterium]